MLLLLKNLIFTLLVPGLIAGWIPLRWFERRAAWPEQLLWQHWLGLAIAAIGAAAYLNSVWHFGRHGRGTPAPIDAPRKFVRRGLYKWVRNPMYLGMLAIVAGESVFLNSWHIGIWFVCLACLFHLFVVMYEEDSLRFRFGAMYEDYLREVNRWLPRPPRPPAATTPPFSRVKR